MQRKIISAFFLALIVAGVVQAATPSWIEEFMILRAPQTRVVRHLTNKDRYYLCWQEGTSRYGIWFSRTSFNNSLRAISPGKSVALATIMSVSENTWTAADQKVCWG